MTGALWLNCHVLFCRVSRLLLTAMVFGEADLMCLKHSQHRASLVTLPCWTTIKSNQKQTFLILWVFKNPHVCFFFPSFQLLSKVYFFMEACHSRLFWERPQSRMSSIIFFFWILSWTKIWASRFQWFVQCWKCSVHGVHCVKHFKIHITWIG